MKNFSNLTKRIWMLVMVFLMSNVTNAALAAGAVNHKNKMISATSVLAEINRDQAEENIRSFLQKSDVQNELIEQGLSKEEVSLRLANLSEQEIRQLSTQVKEARAGGDVLVAVLLVVLIVYLVQRI